MMNTSFHRGLSSSRPMLLLLTLMWGACSNASTENGTLGDIGALGADAVAATDSEAEAEPPPCNADIDCASFSNKLTECEYPICDAQTGRCSIGFTAPGSDCKDGDPCTGPDYCIEGVCGGGPLNCDDENPCTIDFCEPDVGCRHEPNEGEGCDDGDSCTVSDVCAAGACVGTALDDCCVDDAECEDGAPCTTNDCVEGTCLLSLNFAPCNDNSTCTVNDHCDGLGGCVGDGVVCDDGNPCTTDFCDPETASCGVAPAPDGTACEDGNPCTVEDACEAGECVPHANACACTTAADCAPFEDGDACNGTLYCLDFNCIVDPLTVVACNPTADTVCKQSTCDPETLTCGDAALNEGGLCDDQNACTTGDACAEGSCVGEDLSCDDGNPCTADICSPVSGCTFIEVTDPCDDGDACTDNDQCVKAVCAGQSIVCEDFEACTDDSCDSSLGCQYVAAEGPCDDDNPCTEGDLCLEGACVPGSDTCECLVDADCAAVDDDDVCNGVLVCEAGACVLDAETVILCNTTGDTVCRKTSCEAATGACVKADEPNGTLCDDQNTCTLSDMCAAGTCLGAPATCDDQNGCTADGCEPVGGCTHHPLDGVACDDEDGCTQGDTCTQGACEGTALECDDENPCTVDTCDNQGGCGHIAASDGTPCDDGSACTAADQCIAGACAGDPVDCDDDNPCTLDGCWNPDGCVSTLTPDGTPCNDNSACTAGDKCVAGECSGAPITCQDDGPCTVHECVPSTGCEASAVDDGSLCDTGNPCTQDACLDGACAPGPSVCECETADDCAPQEDGNACNGVLVCVANQCIIEPSSVVDCDTSSDTTCTVTICEPADGVCVSLAVTEGTPCSDADACTVDDSCVAGACVGADTGCDDGNLCTDDSCDSSIGCVNVVNAAACDDGDACTIGDVCAGGSCGGSVLECDDGVLCTLDSCDGLTGCEHLNNEAYSETCGSNIGACVAGVRTCAAGVLGDCGGNQEGSEEICNNIDDDCDGLKDEGLVQGCGEDVGECVAGTQTCSKGKWSDCAGDVTPGSETCNDADDDCDGSIDESLTQACGSDVGACAAGLETCANGIWGACDGETTGALETCDDVDEDCDGDIDESLTQVCGTNVGACAEGVSTCASGAWAACAGDITASDETCNGEDDDCDGDTDEGLNCSGSPPTVSCGADIDTQPLATVLLSGTGSDPDGGNVTYAWTVTSAPPGSSSEPADPTSATTTFFVDLGGEYLLTFTVTDDEGEVATCTIMITSVPWQDLHIELVWDEAYGDADLHLTAPGADPALAWYTSQDCFFANGTPNWPANGPAGNPSLDLDDTDGYGPENINIADTPGTGDLQIGVAYYCSHSLGQLGGGTVDNGDGSTTATVNIYCGGVLIEAIGGIQLDETGRFVNVATVTWPGCAVQTVLQSTWTAYVQPAGSTSTFHCSVECNKNSDCPQGESCGFFDTCVLD